MLTQSEFIEINSNHPLAKILVGMLGKEICSIHHVESNRKIDIPSREYFLNLFGGTSAQFHFVDLYVHTIGSQYRHLECVATMQSNGIIELRTNIIGVDSPWVTCMLNPEGDNVHGSEERFTKIIPAHYLVQPQKSLALHGTTVSLKQPTVEELEQSFGKTVTINRDHPLVSFVLNSLKLTHDDSEYSQALVGELVKLKLAIGDTVEVDDLKVGDIPGKSGDDKLTLKIFHDPDQPPHLVTLYALESNVLAEDGKPYLFYIVGSKFAHDIGVATPSRDLMDAYRDGQRALDGLSKELNVEQFVVEAPSRNLPQHLIYNPVTKSYYKYKITPSEGMVPPERELVTFIDVEINPNSSKILRGWNLEELEAIVKHLKEQSNGHM